MTREISASGGLADLAHLGTHVKPCSWNAYGKSVEDSTRIGEIHTDQSVNETFEYHTQEDTTLSVGYSESAGSGYSGHGSLTISGSMAGSGSFPVTPETLRYADGDMYYQRYEFIPGIECDPQGFKVQVDHAIGDAFLGSQSPAPNPYLGCRGYDPHGYAHLNPKGGIFSTDRSRALSYSADATIFGFNFGGSTGFTNDIYQSYVNHSAGAQYVCGTASMPDTPVIYSGSI